MGATAEICKIALAVETDRLRLHVLQEFHLVGFVLGPEKIQCLGLAEFPAGNGQGGSGQLSHFCFDTLKVFRAEGNRTVKIVVKTILDGGANGDLDFLAEQNLDGLCHKVGCGVPENFEARFGVRNDGLDRGVGMQRRCQIDQVTIYCGRKNGLAFFASSTGNGNSNISHSLQYKDGKKKG